MGVIRWGFWGLVGGLVGSLVLGVQPSEVQGQASEKPQGLEETNEKEESKGLGESNEKEEQSQEQMIQAKLRRLVNQRPPQPVLTSKMVMTPDPTLPSLWWTDLQFGNKLVTDWQVYRQDQPHLRLVQVQVRSGIWARFPYSERYAVVNKFGTELRRWGYQLIVLDREKVAIAAYLCDFPISLPSAALPQPQAADHQRSADLEPGAVKPCQLWLSPRYPQNAF